jgi:hypothetical protein
MNLILDLLYWLKDKLLGILSWLADWFMSISMFEKLIVLCTIPAFFAVTEPVARFRIFEAYYSINNPFSVYMIGIVIVMFVTRAFRWQYNFAVRIGLNLYYLAWVVYIGAAREISKAPYETSSGYYLNLLVPLLFIALSSASYFLNEE